MIRAEAGKCAIVVLALAVGCRYATATGAPAEPKDRPTETTATPDTRAGPDKEVTYPVVTVRALRRSFKQLVLGYGTVLADARSARSVAAATMLEIRSVEVLPGERVKSGQPLLTAAPDPQTYLAARQAASALKLAKADAERLVFGRADGLATTLQVETAQKALADAAAAVEAAQRQQAGAATLVLRAPVDGIVTAVGAGVGDRPAAGAVLVTIAPIAAPRVTLGIEPGEQRLVHVGDRVSVRPVQTNSEASSGKVIMVGAAVDKTSRLVNVTVALDPPHADDFLADMAIEGRIEARQIEAFDLPRSALIKDEEGLAVFELVGGKAHRVPVVLAAEDGARVGVSGALDTNRPVVSVGAYELGEGVAVVERKP